MSPSDESGKANEKRTESAERSGAKRTTARTSAATETALPTSTGDPFADAARDYVIALNEAFTPDDSQEKAMSAYDDLVRAAADDTIPDDQQKRLGAAYAKLQGAGQGAGGTAPTAAAAWRAQQEYADIAREVANDRQARAALAKDYYLQVVKDTPAAVHDRVAEGWLSYLEALRAAWAGLDPESLSAGQLQAIAGSIASTAAVHASVSAQVEQSVVAASAFTALARNSG